MKVLKVKLGLSNYATKNWFKVDRIDMDKLKAVPGDLSKLNSVVKNVSKNSI